MESREIVRRAIEFDTPPRLPFFLGGLWGEKLKEIAQDIPNDVLDCWEMDRQENGWFFDNAAPDDWGCEWQRTHIRNMGQVVHGALEEGWHKLDSYVPPNPRNPFYFKRIEEGIRDAGDKYVILTSHFNLIERYHMLRGFVNSMEDFYLEKENAHKLIDMILEYKIEHLREAAKWFGDRVHGIFLSDDWGTQNNTFVSAEIFKEFFIERYKKLFSAIHDLGWHAILHSCGRINDFVPFFIDAGVDVMNMQQPLAYGIVEIGERFAGKVCFLSTVDIQATLPGGNAERVIAEAGMLVKQWSTADGGFIVFNYGNSEGIGTSDEITKTMFREFNHLKDYWQKTAAITES